MAEVEQKLPMRKWMEGVKSEDLKALEFSKDFDRLVWNEEVFNI